MFPNNTNSFNFVLFVNWETLYRLFTYCTHKTFCVINIFNVSGHDSLQKFVFDFNYYFQRLFVTNASNKVNNIPGFFNTNVYHFNVILGFYSDSN